MKKELVVSAIKNGTVIDHIPADKLFQVIRALDLNDCTEQILMGNNLTSHKLGKKGIIKCQDKFFQKEEINKIALITPHATLITIREYEVVEKIKIGIPDTIEGMVKCFNPKCITNNEVVTQKFTVINKEDVMLQCRYCQKITKKEMLTFL
ncbi:MAG: aspartate carbamoyltransferase regulatory subunit [Prevotellaceae bacterium]|jgi:aspartate carbamoyltransferase regulatory subunit|nr:aspartate carbamoyltransferase regulatory subunit [Prevotellaceae bacterium]